MTLLFQGRLLSEREFLIDNLLVRIHCIIVIIRWTGLAPWEFEFSFPGSLTSTFLERQVTQWEFASSRFSECCPTDLYQKHAKPLEARKGSILLVGLLRWYQLRGAFGHALSNIRYRVTKRLKGGGHVGLL